MCISNIKTVYGEVAEIDTFIKNAQKELDGITAAIAQRIAEEQGLTQNRISQLTARINDVSVSETAKHIVRGELERLQAKVIEPTAEEISLFNKTMERARSAVQDEKKATEKLDDAIRGVRIELDELKNKNSRFKEDVGLAPRWLDGRQEKFDRVLRG